MRTIDANMQTALAAKTRRPAVGLTIEDHTIHLSAYQSPGLADQWSDVCIANDGSIIRVNLTRGGGGFTSSFQFARITDPSVALQWQTVTTFASASGNMFQDGGCCVSNNGGTLRAFAQQGTGGNALFVWTSANNGASWTGPVTVVSPPGGALTKGIGSAGNNDVFFLYDVTGGEKMAVSTFNGTSWSAITNWTLADPVSGAGVAVYWTGSIYNIVYSDGFTLFAATFDGTTWTQLFNIASTTTDSVGHISPRLTFFNGLYHLCVSEFDTGTITGSVYQYGRVRESPDFAHWSDGFIIPEVSSQFGGNYFFLSAPQSGTSGARYYFSTPSTVLSTPQFNQTNTNQYLDVSSSILSYKRVEKINKAAEFIVVVDNKAGVYNGLVNLSGGTTYEPINAESTLKLSEGYYVGGPPPTTRDTIATGAYRVQKIEMLRTPDENMLQITGLDLSERLDRHIRWQVLFTNQTIQFLVIEVCARAGLFSPVVTGGTQLSQVVPTFTMQANATYRHALDALCATYGLEYFVDESEVIHIREILTSDTSVWTYQPEIEQVSFGADFNRANHVIANGKPPTGGSPFALSSAESYDNVANANTRVERLLHHTDFKSTTSAQAQIAAGLIMYAQQRKQADTRLIVPLHPALQLTDVVTVNDYAAPTGTGQSAVGRIIEHEAIYDAQKAEYESHFILEAK